MNIKRKKMTISREKAEQLILNTEPSLTKEIMKNYTLSEVKEWMRLLKMNVAIKNDCHGVVSYL